MSTLRRKSIVTLLIKLLFPSFKGRAQTESHIPIHTPASPKGFSTPSRGHTKIPPTVIIMYRIHSLPSPCWWQREYKWIPCCQHVITRDGVESRGIRADKSFLKIKYYLDSMRSRGTRKSPCPWQSHANPSPKTAHLRPVRIHDWQCPSGAVPRRDSSGRQSASRDPWKD